MFIYTATHAIKQHITVLFATYITTNKQKAFNSTHQLNPQPVYWLIYIYIQHNYTYINGQNYYNIRLHVATCG